MNYKQRSLLVCIVVILVCLIALGVGVWTGKMPLAVQSILFVVITFFTATAFLGSFDLGDDKKRPDPTCPNCHWSVLRSWKHCPECGHELKNSRRAIHAHPPR